METGVTIRNMGLESTAAVMAGCARAAEAAGLESVWITDHIAIPPDDAEGSGGRYVDPLVTLSWMAGFTSTIRLGTGVLILPYRTALPTAKQVASLQELSGERLLLGVGIGWMDAEFAAVGVPRRERGRRSDEMLAFMRDCFVDDVVSANGQPLLFKPRPSKPPFLVGGRAPHAVERAARLGDGWLPMARSPDKLAGDVTQYRTRCRELGRGEGSVTVMTGLPLDDTAEAAALLNAYSDAGADRLVCAIRYSSVPEYEDQLGALTAAIAAAS